MPTCCCCCSSAPLPIPSAANRRSPRPPPAAPPPRPPCPRAEDRPPLGPRPPLPGKAAARGEPLTVPPPPPPPPPMAVAAAMTSIRAVSRAAALPLPKAPWPPPHSEPRNAAGEVGAEASSFPAAMSCLRLTRFLNQVVNESGEMPYSSCTASRTWVGSESNRNKLSVFKLDRLVFLLPYCSYGAPHMMLVPHDVQHCV